MIQELIIILANIIKLKNCAKCENGNTCEECEENYILKNNDKLCIS